VLIVDTDPCRCALNAGVLRRQGYEVDAADDAQTGWAALQNNLYNLVIAENDLPGLSGVGLLKKLRSAGMTLPVIIAIEALPAWKSADYPWLLKSARLFKPYTFEDLLRLVNRTFAQTQRSPAETAPPHPQNQTASAALRRR
jgi:DNA-binding NtrC family response regulator